jgi:cysteine synthase
MVFTGANAIKDLLDPDKQPPLPLVELPEPLNPFHSDRVKIFAKLFYLCPLLNLKSLPALNMMLDAEARGALAGVHTVVEASSGNTAFAIAIVARMFGISRIQAVVPRDIAPGKLELLRLAGADPIFSSEIPGQPSGIAIARKLGQRQGCFNAGQYENEANPEAHEKWTGKQLWEQLGPSLTVYCCGLGTTGTLIGAKRFFDKQSAKVTVVGVVCDPQSAVPGVRSERRLQEIAFDWRSMLDECVDMAAKESFKRSLELCRNGLIAGPSSGFAYGGLLRFLKTQRQNGDLDRLRNSEGDVVAAFICGDSPLPYLDKYSTYLDPADFGPSTGLEFLAGEGI